MSENDNNFAAGLPGAGQSGVPGAVPPGLPGAVQSGVPGAVQSGVPGAVQSGVPGAVPPGLPGAVQSGVPGAVPPGVPGAVQVSLSEAVQAGLSGSLQPVALYLLPFGYHIAATGMDIVDAHEAPVMDLRCLPRTLTLGLGAFQPLHIVARWADGTYSYACAHEVEFTSAQSQVVNTHFDEEIEWSGLEGCAFTEHPVRVTARWHGGTVPPAQVEVRVEPVQALLWMPDSYEISADGLGFVTEAGETVTELPKRQAVKVGESLCLRAVARYGDGKYQVMSRSELEYALVDDWLSADYDADRDVYEINVLQDSALAAEVMLVALSSEDLLASFWVEAV